MSTNQPTDPRPGVWIGHVVLQVPEPARSRQFFIGLGMRDLGHDGQVAILELRGGTHLLLLPTVASVAAGTPAPFDLMVDDLEASREQLSRLGLAPSRIEESEYHRFFTIPEPGGYLVTVHSSHVSGSPV